MNYHIRCYCEIILLILCYFQVTIITNVISNIIESVRMVVMYDFLINTTFIFILKVFNINVTFTKLFIMTFKWFY